VTANSACTAGITTVMLHIPTPPRVLIAVLATSRRQA